MSHHGDVGCSDRAEVRAAMPERTRLIALDLLRLVAVVLVLGRHMPGPPKAYPFLVRLPFLAWMRSGWVGVDLFFVLCGFLVSGLLFAEFKSRGRLGIGRFYVRRAWKIYPSFFLLITATVILAFAQHRSLPMASLMSELLFLQSYIPGLWNHTWSLAVEEHFYLLLPPLLWVVWRCNRGSASPFRPIVGITACVAIATLALRVLNWYVRPTYSHLTHLYPTHLRLDSLLFGVAIAYFYQFHSPAFTHRVRPYRVAMMFGGILLLAPASILALELSPFVYTFGLTFFYVGSGLLLMAALVTPISHSRLAAALASLGTYSYSIYLWHIPVLYWGIPFVERLIGKSLGYEAWLLLYFGGSVGIGILMANVVEGPMLRIRDTWFPSRCDPSRLISTRCSAATAPDVMRSVASEQPTGRASI